MGVFGERAPCPRCGKRVRKPKNAADFVCSHCHQPGPWATPEQVAAWDRDQAAEREAERVRADARERYSGFLVQLSTGAAGSSIVPALKETSSLTGYERAELDKLNLDAWYRYATLAVSDDLITPQEDAHLRELVAALGLTSEQVHRTYPGILNHLLIASINGGLLPQVESSRLIVKRGEVVHLEWPATLMKEVTLREYRGGYQGFSFPIGKTGIRYRVGGVRGKSVVVGTQLQVADEGALCISSLRAVFIGTKKTMEMPYSKLVSLDVYADGVAFHMSNRQTVPLFRVTSGEVVAAMVNAAAQRMQ